MTRAAIPMLLFGLAAVLRIHNAWVAQPLSGFDGPYHAAYIGAIHWDGRFQLPHGFTNHPPLYYAVCAGIWKILPASTSPHVVLFALRLVNVVCGLALGAAVWASARRLFPERTALGYYALALALFLPMYIGASSLLGNQMMSTALAAVAFAALLRCLDDPRPRYALVAGLVAGLGVLTKLSVGIVVAVGGIVLAVRGWQLHGLRVRALLLASLFGVTAAGVASPHFIRNYAYSDVAIDPRVDVWSGVDRSRGQGTRPWSAYFDLHPGSIVHPGTFDERAKQAVWPVTFSSIWFDVFGTTVDVYDPNAQRLARILYAFGAFFTLAALVGAIAAIRKWSRSSVTLGLPALALLVTITAASFVAFTRAVGTHAALKGTYFSPGITGFVMFAAIGLACVSDAGRAGRQAIAGLLAAFALCVVLIFWQGGLAPMRVNPADFYMRDYSDPPSRRAFSFFLGRRVLERPAPHPGPQPRGARPRG